MGRRKRGEIQMSRQEAARLYQEGHTQERIASLGGVVRGTIHTWLKDAGVLRAQPQPFRRLTYCDGFFDTVTRESAWVVGLILGDGHVNDRPNQRWVDIVGSQQVLSIVQELWGGREPRKKPGSECWYLRASRKRFVKALLALDVKSGNKARVVRLPTVSAPMLPHVLRGMWDADGSWRAIGNRIETTYSSSSKRLIHQLRRLVGGRIDLHRTVLRDRGPQKDSWRLVLRQEETRAFARWIYSRSEGLRCERKFGVAAPLLGGVLSR